MKRLDCLAYSMAVLWLPIACLCSLSLARRIYCSGYPAFCATVIIYFLMVMKPM